MDNGLPDFERVCDACSDDFHECCQSFLKEFGDDLVPNGDGYDLTTLQTGEKGRDGW